MQIALAHAHELTLVIHARDAWDDLFDVLSVEGVPERTVLHCFTGGPDEVDRCLRAGMFVSFSGIITFKNASDIREAAARCPIDRLLVETDSPFLAPVPHRGRANEPALLPLVGATVAEVKGCRVEMVAASTAAAAATAFAIAT
jgi:TatD DNase family protein